MSISFIFSQLFFSLLVTYSFCLIFNVKGKASLFSSIGGALSWLSYLIGLQYGWSDGLNYLIATILIALFSEIMARVLKTPVTTLLIAALIPLAPGGGVYYTMYYLIQNMYHESFLKAVQTCVIASAMALGIIIVSTIFKIYTNILKKIKYKDQ
ncbi:threonine/serine exporter family protein [Cetobacterium sp. SF1]|uniref:threonine/serine exporter family protein n=1 Tax=Cetobacterium sp. SF1 TaxID=3417654 RepID=UPI003CF706BB